MRERETRLTDDGIYSKWGGSDDLGADGENVLMAGEAEHEQGKGLQQQQQQRQQRATQRREGRQL